MSSVHIINHTHWDREWFLTHEYTTAWIPALVESLSGLAAANNSYEFLFDGQTLVVEDLLATKPEHELVIGDLIKSNALTIGPVYSQPDWRMVSGELHLRNLLYGIGDAQSLGGNPTVAWLVDTFGHISQAPQLLELVGIDSAFVWRGVPQMTPLFTWKGSDGTEIPTVDLFSGYRNLYGVTKTPAIAVKRLVAEVEKLAPVYGDLPIPLFDGYDLDTEPEDPARYYEDLSIPEWISMQPSSPRAYLDAVLPFIEDAPTINGELLSGKFGSTFPGSLSSRTYLKLLHHDAEIALHRRVEPLATLGAAMGAEYDERELERRSRELLQNGVHDCICGVSIDQVHERMERSYQQILGWAAEREASYTSKILSGFASGWYSVATHAMATDSTQRIGNQVYLVRTDGVGVRPVEEPSVASVAAPSEVPFRWSNPHFDAVVDRNGLTIDGIPGQGRIVVRRDHGDTYSSEPAEVLGTLGSDGPIAVSRSEHDAEVTFDVALSAPQIGIDVTASMTLRFDHTPLIGIRIDLDSSGTGFRADVHFDSGIETDTVFAGMPFDIVDRVHQDHDLLGADLSHEMQSILMGQRETGLVDEFPFHDFVGVSSEDRTWAVLARGNRSYSSSASGGTSVALRRSAEWLALTGLERRIGDAGPAMYVPGARCERRVKHQLAIAVISGERSRSELLAYNEAFQNSPLIAEVTEGTGTARSWSVLSEQLPLSSLAMVDGEAVARLFNPNEDPHRLSTTRAMRSPRGANAGDDTTVGPKKIASFKVALEPPDTSGSGAVRLLNPTHSRVGKSRSKPDPRELVGLRERIEVLESQLADNAATLLDAQDDEVYRLTHKEYVLQREQLELRLSLELNERLANSTSEVSIPDDADPVIADLGWALNELRVKRRIYDYVVQALPPPPERSL
ncbi:MAG: hypothetical protein ACN4GZ_12330 [Acidimicrobiales bacterium]